MKKIHYTYDTPADYFDARAFARGAGESLSDKISALTQALVSTPSSINRVQANKIAAALEVVALDVDEVETFLATGEVDVDDLDKAAVERLFARLLTTDTGVDILRRTVQETVTATRDAIAVVLRDRDMNGASNLVRGLPSGELALSRTR